MRINEIFTSIDGEVNYYGQGTISTFIRLQGCELDCHYCDTPLARDPNGGEEMEIGEIVERVKAPKVTITGGEPLEQPHDLQALVNKLHETGINSITVETNGTIKLPGHLAVNWVVDCKLDQPFNREIYAYLDRRDYIKIILASPLDLPTVLERYRWFKQSGCQARIAVSPVWENMRPKQLMEALIEKGIYDIQINIQLHKYIGVK